MDNVTKNAVAFLFGLFLCFIVLEVFLRIYRPFPSRLKGNDIVLSKNKRYFFENNIKISKLDRKIIHTKNSIGFRGEPPPKDFDKYLSVITVGGSTTECFYLSDNKTWPHLLGEKLKKSHSRVWLNNAGLDGLSTFGQIVLLKKYLIKLKPKIIIFLVGINDVERDDLRKYDRRLINIVGPSKKDLKSNSETISFLINIWRVLNANKRQLGHKDLDITKLSILEISQERRRQELERHRSRYLQGYRRRLLELVNICKDNGIEPIFITQPTLLGKGFDKITGVNLETVRALGSINGKLYWEILELYNNSTKDVAKSTGAFVIDLANKLPKNSLYFYDYVHFSKEGAREVAGILFRDLKNWLDEKYKPFCKNLRCA